MFIPLIYVIIQLFIAYAVIVTVVTNKSNLNKVVSLFFSFYFTFFLVLGQSFSAGLFAAVPMVEKKGGLRQMMHMSGLTSVQYFSGLFLGDLLLFTVPAVVITLALLGFEQIMQQSQVGNFFVSFMLYGCAIINMCYICTHIFDDPDTSFKYIAIIFSLVFLIAPISVSLIFAAIFGFDSSVGSALSIWYFVDPQLCFVIQLFSLCTYGNPDLANFQIKLFGSVELTTGLYCGVIFY